MIIRNNFYIWSLNYQSMKGFRIFIIIVVICSLTQHSQAQSYYEHEFSFSLGLFQLRSDYGINNDFETNFGNQGVAFSFNYYYNNSVRRQASYFQEHFKYRLNLTYSTVNLEHFGPDSDDPRLASMEGSYNNFSIGNGFEYYPLGIEMRKFYSSGSFLDNLSPFAGLGLGVNFVTPDATSSLPGGLIVPDNVFPTFQSESSSRGIDLDNRVSLSLNFQVGVRYKVNDTSDIYLESSWMFFDSDFIDGLSPVGPQNKNDDWSWGINLGYTYTFF